VTETIHRNSLKPGHTLHWYRIEKILGQGGFGITYLAHDNNLHRQVAIKEYLPIELAVREGNFSIQPVSENHREQFQWGLDRFLSEARTLAKFDHPNIVRVLAVFEENNTGYMVMNYEQGMSLAEKLKGRKTLEEAEIIKFMLPIMGGLEQMHEAGFIHRDIKPDNIFIRKDGSPVLLDFGSARQALGGQTRTLTSLVTPGYAPFEQYYAKSNEQGPWTDIYGLGATLYRATTGVAPVDAVDRSNALLKRSNDTYTSCVDLAKNRYSERLLSAIDQALQFNIEDRPQTVNDWRSEFGLPDTPLTSARTESIPTQPGTSFLQKHREKTSRPGSSPRPVIYKSIITLAVLLALAGTGWWYQEDIRNIFEKREQSERIQALLDNAGNDVKTQNFVRPASDNALEKYRQVLAIDPDNANARLELQTITNQLVNLAKGAMDAGNFPEAEKYLADAAQVLPDATNIKLARDQLAQKKTEKKRAKMEEKERREQLQLVLGDAETAISNGDAITVLSKLDQARALGAEQSTVSSLRSKLQKRLEALSATAAEEAKLALKANDTVKAREALSRARELKDKAESIAAP